jgi:mono/diheme cytochrome c family protein
LNRIIAVLIGGGALALAVFFLGSQKWGLSTAPEDIEAMPAPALYARTCASCHGMRGEGRTNFAPPLRGLNLPIHIIKKRIREGGQKMPALPFIQGAALERLAGYVAGFK